MVRCKSRGKDVSSGFDLVTRSSLKVNTNEVPESTERRVSHQVPDLCDLSEPSNNLSVLEPDVGSG